MTEELHSADFFGWTAQQAALLRAGKYARTGAARETGLDRNTFPNECPWLFEQALDNEFWPE